MVKISSHGFKNIHPLIRGFFKISLQELKIKKCFAHYPQIPWWKIWFRPSGEELLFHGPTFCKNFDFVVIPELETVLPSGRKHSFRMFEIVNKRKKVDLWTEGNNNLCIKTGRIQISVSPNLHAMGTSDDLLW